jgi:hypothetical protein
LKQRVLPVKGQNPFLKSLNAAKMYTMKKKNPFFIVLLLIVLSTVACQFHGHRTKTVKVSNGDGYLNIEYRGDVQFTEDGTAIEAIAPSGYIKYSNNGQRLIVESDEDGTLRYKLYDGNHRLHKNDPRAGALMSQAVQLMHEHYYR